MTDNLVIASEVPALPKGARVKFVSEKQAYTVRASDGERFAVLTKPFNARRTVLYTIVDRVERIRGRENLIFCMGFETDEKCFEALVRLVSGESAVSHRHYGDLDIEWVRA